MTASRTGPLVGPWHETSTATPAATFSTRRRRRSCSAVEFGAQLLARGALEAELHAARRPPRARRLVAEWARTNQAALRENWERARRHEPL